MWLQSLLGVLGVQQMKPPLVWYDNFSTVSLPVNPVLHSHTKHMEQDL